MLKKMLLRNIRSWVVLAICVQLVVAIGAVGVADSTNPKYGGTAIVLENDDPPTLAGALTTDSGVAHMVSPCLEGLLRLGYENGQYVALPNLAKSWQVSDDGLVYIFRLEENVYWHDGEPFSSADVEFTLNEIIRKYHPMGKQLLGFLDSVETPDSSTVVVKLSVPFPGFLIMLNKSHGFGTIMPKHIYEGTDYLTNPHNFAPIGTGPFKFEEWERGTYITYVRNDDYWREGLPYLDKVVFRLIPDSSTVINLLLAGEAHYADWSAIPLEQMYLVEQSDKLVKAKTPQSIAGMLYLNFNVRNEPLKDVLVRRAIAYAIDRDLMSELGFEGLAKATSSHVSSALPLYWNPNRPLDRFKPNIELANKMLDEAGYLPDSNGVRFELDHVFSAGQNFQFAAADVIHENLKSVGIITNRIAVEQATMTEKAYNEWDFDLHTVTLSGGPLPEIYISRLYDGNNIRRGVPFTNNSGYSNPEIDQLLNQASLETNEELRFRLWCQIQNILADDLPVLPLVELPYLHPYSVRLHGFDTSPNESGGEIWWAWVWVE